MSQQLTFFFLMTSFGGALGGLVVVLLAPALFSGFDELHIPLGAELSNAMIHRDLPV
ncbi:MAG TPA: hypothetical protein QGF41_07595 [Gammaproteobacteria bacterium]|jgi:hypothetical protein|nr:hypothetical protein [Gammaproteobacteria bacterium]|tara:strand:- start:68330 stop:68500 length:171 start_codon:yes stop_codon:yes gene_type:complete